MEILLPGFVKNVTTERALDRYREDVRSYSLHSLQQERGSHRWGAHLYRNGAKASGLIISACLGLAIGSYIGSLDRLGVFALGATMGALITAPSFLLAEKFYKNRLTVIETEIDRRYPQKPI